MSKILSTESYLHGCKFTKFRIFAKVTPPKISHYFPRLDWNTGVLKSRSLSVIFSLFLIELYIHHQILFSWKMQGFLFIFGVTSDYENRLTSSINIYIEVFIQYLLYISLTVWNLVMLNLNIELKMNIKFQNKRRPTCWV